MWGKRPCPRCQAPVLNRARYVFTAYLFPMACPSCEAKVYLGYHPVVFVLLWFCLSPLYLFAILYLCVRFAPAPWTLPAFFAVAFASAAALPLLGRPVVKPDKASRRRPFSKP